MLKELRRQLTRRPVVGLDLGVHGVKWALVDVANRHIESLGYLPARGPAGATLWEQLPRGVRRLRTAVCGQDVAYGYFELGPVDRRQLPAAAQAQAQTTIPFSPEETHFSYCETPALSQRNGHIGIFYVAARRSRVEKLTYPFHQCGFEVGRVDLPALALCREYLCNHGAQPEAVLLINVGHRLTQLVLTRQGYPYFARDFSTAGQDFLYSLAMGLQCSREEAEQFLAAYDFRERHFVVEPALLRWLDLVQRSLNNAESRLNLRVSKVLLSGGSALPGLAERLSERLNRSVSSDGWQRLRPPAGEELARMRPELFKVAIGLALEV
jgi:Tfp pilus assembly PilM family ATPase